MKKTKIGIGIFLVGVLILSGCTSESKSGSTAVVEGNTQKVSTTFLSRKYESIEVKVGVPVIWEIELSSEDLNGCNNELAIPEYNITKQLQAGKNIVEFTPKETGTYPYSCWMGMIQSQIKVVK